MSAIGEKIAAEVNRLAAENPDFIYPHEDCAYVREGEPACLYGHALWNLGLIDSSFEQRRGVGYLGIDSLLNYQPIDIVLERLDIKVDNNEARAFIEGQETQDNYRPWDVSAREMNKVLAS